MADHGRAGGDATPLAEGADRARSRRTALWWTAALGVLTALAAVCQLVGGIGPARDTMCTYTRIGCMAAPATPAPSARSDSTPAAVPASSKPAESPAPNVSLSMTPLIASPVAVTAAPLTITILRLHASPSEIVAVMRLVNSGELVTIYGCQLTIPGTETLTAGALGNIAGSNTETIKTVTFTGTLPPGTGHIVITLTPAYGLAKGMSITIPVDITH